MSRIFELRLLSGVVTLALLMGLAIHLVTFLLPLPDLETLQAWTIWTVLGVVFLTTLSSPIRVAIGATATERFSFSRFMLRLLPYTYAAIWFYRVFFGPDAPNTVAYQADVLRGVSASGIINCLYQLVELRNALPATEKRQHYP